MYRKNKISFSDHHANLPFQNLISASVARVSLADDETRRHCEIEEVGSFARLDIKEKVRIRSVVSHKTKKLFQTT